jgi:predicted component of type VI protein secretion system
MSSVHIVVIDHQAGKRLVDRSFAEFPVRIGREAGSHVELAYPFVSRRHAELQRSGDELRLHMLSEKNELALGGRRLAAGASVPLVGPLVAAIGALELRIVPAAAAAPAPLPAAASDDVPDLRGLAPAQLAPRQGVLDSELAPDFSGSIEDHSDRLGRIHAAVRGLRPVHERLNAARKAWDAALSAAVLAQQAADPAGVATLLREFPRLDWLGHAPPGTDAFADEQRRGAVVQAAAELLPGLRAPADLDESRRFLARVIDVLRVFAACTLELSHVRAQQAGELGAVWRGDDDPLAAMETPAAALAYLVDWREPGERRSEELVRLFAGLSDHQRAYARAALLAAREAVASIAPVEIERGADAGWPVRAAALWRHYTACFAALVGEPHDNLTPLFRAALARGYRDTLARAGVALRPDPETA